MEEQEPLIYLKPKFNPIRFFLDRYAMTLVSMIVIMSLYMNVATNKIANIELYFAIATVLFIVYIIIRGFLRKKKYKFIEYFFYEDRVIILNSNKRGKDYEILYRDILDIMLVQNFLQKFFDEGEFLLKLSEGRFFAKTISLIGISNYAKTTKKVARVVYGTEV